MLGFPSVEWLGHMTQERLLCFNLSQAHTTRLSKSATRCAVHTTLLWLRSGVLGVTRLIGDGSVHTTRFSQSKITNTEVYVIYLTVQLTLQLYLDESVTFVISFLFSCYYRLFPEMLKAWDGCQKYFYRSWARRTALQSALQHASKVIADTLSKY